MRRRIRLDLGQSVPSKESQEKLDRQRQRWAARNRSKPEEENPFVAPILPASSNYGDESESYEELQKRLENLEFGNFPGYFNYRNKAATNHQAKEGGHNVDNHTNQEDESKLQTQEKSKPNDTNSAMTDRSKKSTLEHGLDDERLEFLQSDWFKGKEVLDIGCNRGHITYAIAKLFSPNFILGIDIDPKIIHSAMKDLRAQIGCGPPATRQINRYSKRVVTLLKIDQTSDQNELYGTSIDKYDAGDINPADIKESKSHKRQRIDPTSQGDSGLINQYQVVVDGNSRDSSVPSSSGAIETSQFPNNLYFVEHNYVLAKDELVDKQQAFFDTIVCLSVTKWIHLNYRDAGLKRFFRRIYKHLKPGGLLVLEVQPFDNYGRRKKMSDRLRANYYTIKFKPDQFDEYLLSEEVGFKRILTSTTTVHQCAGFKRPLKVFEK